MGEWQCDSYQSINCERKKSDGAGRGKGIQKYSVHHATESGVVIWCSHKLAVHDPQSSEEAHDGDQDVADGYVHYEKVLTISKFDSVVQEVDCRGAQDRTHERYDCQKGALRIQVRI